jgi:hypothetical protein
MHAYIHTTVGEESSASACWRRVITLISVIITTIDYDSHEDPSFAAQKSTHHANLTQLVCQFFNDFKVSVLGGGGTQLYDFIVNYACFILQ